MYGIYSEGKLLQLTGKPRYIYKNHISNAWVEIRDGIEEEAVAINGTIYNIFGKPKVDEAAKTVMIKEVDPSEIIFEQQQKLVQAQADLDYIAMMTKVDLSE